MNSSPDEATADADALHPRPGGVKGTTRGTTSTALRKAVDTLAIVPTKDRISVLARKVYNVMMYYAQIQGVDHQIYRVRLRDVINGLDFNSNNTEVLKEHLRQMVTTKVEWQSPTKGEGARWGVSTLISHAELMHEGGEVMMEWSYAPNIKQAILDPQRFARISLSFQAALKSMAALVLYEICSRYVDNPGGVTARQHWTWWRPVLTGMPDGQSGAYHEWKYFKRDVIKGAVFEVNQITDLQIEAIEHRKGRAVVDLQFSVTKKVQQKLPLATVPSPINLKDIGRAIGAGVQQDRAEKLFAKFGAEAFSKGVDALEGRHGRNDLESVRAPDKFLAAVLANMSGQVPLLKPVEVQKGEDKAARVALLEKYRDSRRREADALYNEMIEEKRNEHLARFERSAVETANPALQRTYKSRGLAAPMTRALFLKFLAEDLFGRGWDSPSDTDLLAYSLRN
ncbi:MAG: RepB family plasmid replication initiator protein [Burkholderiaceae bacterium]|nr:MAG: RepB family plasmid replication initiator protein [Burkholderiaceae bacterium]